MTAGGVADHDDPIGEVFVGVHGIEPLMDGLARAGPPTARHTDAGVLEIGDVEPILRQPGSERLQIGAVVGGAPVAAMNERHGEPSGAPGFGLPHVVEVCRERPGHFGAGGEGGRHTVTVTATTPNAAGLSVGNRVQGMQQWEYATVPLIVHATKQILDQWGQDGWELVQVLVMPEGNLVAYLKRAKA